MPFALSIDARRQSFYFPNEFLGIIYRKRLTPPSWIMIWIYYCVFNEIRLDLTWITLIRYVFQGFFFKVGGLWGRINSLPTSPHPFLTKTCQNYTKNSKFGTKVHTHICFQKKVFQYQESLNFADASIFLEKKNQYFQQKQYLYSKQQCKSCIRDFLVLLSVSVI